MVEQRRLAHPISAYGVHLRVLATALRKREPLISSMRILRDASGEGTVSGPSDHTVTVLVVDDNPDLCALVTDVLTKLRAYHVITAEDGVQGLERYFEARPNCVVVDVNMPHVNGYQLIRALRGDPASAGTPLVILSAMVQERDQLAGYLSGADEYLIKPVSALDLVQTIDRVLARSEDERERRIQALLDALAADAEG